MKNPVREIGFPTGNFGKSSWPEGKGGGRDHSKRRWVCLEDEKEAVMRKIVFSFIVLSFLVPFSGKRAFPAEYPTRPIEVIVGFAPGGGVDVLFRVIAKHLSQELKKPIVVVNKPGGGTIPAILEVLKAKPDGYTLLCESNAHSAYQIGRTDIPFNPMERTYICKIAQCPHVLFCDPKMPWKNLAEVAASLKEKPEQFTWGGMGGPSTTSYSQLQFFHLAGADLKKIKKVVYTGSGPILTAVAGGHIQFGSAGASAVPPFQQSGKVRSLVITGDQGLRILPGVPSAQETGYPGVDVAMWDGLSGPPNLPSEVVAALNKAVQKIAQSAEFIADLEKIAAVPVYQAPDAFRKAVLEEGEFAKTIREIDK
jgi:tripartite-type tricarboxylate transporter receptor subunit TctC